VIAEQLHIASFWADELAAKYASGVFVCRERMTNHGQ
jgi:hypothetical protein